jgi:hypothetical protein
MIWITCCTIGCGARTSLLPFSPGEDGGTTDASATEASIEAETPDADLGGTVSCALGSPDPSYRFIIGHQAYCPSSECLLGLTDLLVAILINPPTPLGPMTIVIPQDSLHAEAEVAPHGHNGVRAFGTLTLTQFSPNGGRVLGSFSLTLPDGSTLVDTFDATPCNSPICP